MRDSPQVSAPGVSNGGAAKPAPRPASKGPLTLAIDIGGTGLKATVLDAGGLPIEGSDRVLTPRPATPEAILEALSKLVAPLGAFDRVSAGFPGIVRDGVVKTAPNLDPSWDGVPLASRLARLMKRPARVLNDAGVQGLGVIQGVGVEMILTFGTGLGSGLFYEGTYVPNLELGHHPFRKGKTYEDYLGHGGLASDGLTPAPRLGLVDQTGIHVGVDRHLLAGKCIERETRRNFSRAHRTVRDDEELDRDQGQK